ncbi:MAG: hypothetical protein AAFQ87_01960 [Bacteroidota bacterium]
MKGIRIRFKENEEAQILALLQLLQTLDCIETIDAFEEDHPATPGEPMSVASLLERISQSENLAQNGQKISTDQLRELLTK